MKLKNSRPLGPLAALWLLLVAGPALAQLVVDWTPGALVPDNNPVGIVDSRLITFDSAAVITGLEVRLNLTGGWNGDMYASLVHDSGFTVLLNRPGNTALNPGGSGSSGMNVTFSHGAATDIHTGISTSGFITGTWQPDARTADPLTVTDLSTRSAFLTSFYEAPVQGNWTLFLADNAASDTTTLAGWGLTITSEIRDFAIWDSNGNTSGVGGAGSWTSTSSTWATSNVGTSTAAQAVAAQLVFDGTGGAVNVTGTVSPEAGMRFKTNGYQLTGGTVQLAGATPAANTILVEPAVTARIGSVLAGSNGLTKSGTGTLVLENANNTYSGTTSVTAGTLQVGSAGTGTTGTGAVTVDSGSTIMGTGTVRGSSITLANGATLHAGDTTAASIGTLTFTPASGTGTFTLQVGSSTVADISYGVGSDLLIFDGLSSGTLNFDGNLQVRGDGLTPTIGQSFNLIDWMNLSSITFNSRFNAGSYTGFIVGNGDDTLGFDLPDLSGVGLAWDISSFTADGTIVIVPEPSRALLLMLGMVGLFLRRRRA